MGTRATAFFVMYQCFYSYTLEEFNFRSFFDDYSSEEFFTYTSEEFNFCSLYDDFAHYRITGRKLRILNETVNSTAISRENFTYQNKTEGCENISSLKLIAS